MTGGRSEPGKEAESPGRRSTSLTSDYQHQVTQSMSPNQPTRRRLAPPQECQDLDLNGLHRLVYLNTGFLAGGAEMVELWGGEI